MLTPSPQYGLRQVLIHVTIGDYFPPSTDSAPEISLLRAANRSMLRKKNGTTDVFLFVLVGHYDTDMAREVISGYGFTNFSVITMESDQLDEQLSISYGGNVSAEVGDCVSSWLNREHPGALALFSREYQSAPFWWTGIEHDDGVLERPFNTDDFASELPATHRTRAATWLIVLGNVAKLHTVQATSPDVLGSDRAASWAATLCEWLHGFNAASGNGYNDFDADSVSEKLGMSDFYLGFEFARLCTDDLETLCDEHDLDLDKIGWLAVAAITANLRDELRSMLSDFFDGDSGLLWVLYSSIWPRFAKPMVDYSQELLQTDDYNRLAELDAPWRFVSEGWCDEADV
ncbi:hypothetical protein [Sulfurirhabdus autotrophica]|uniref:Uncharacterized protein n=1 Tax=Sulfurirhabdus autotrophica TaxID=1706046 RepID=A0A4R3XTA4_9PROT|nr:hypothetical protein [Sulfurirhabdus autotrophica]TCV81288.1 hypothetical protein EDC63_12437 [Sulfurirhabdus autotrophica]